MTDKEIEMLYNDFKGKPKSELNDVLQRVIFTRLEKKREQI